MDGQTVSEARAEFEVWIDPMLEGVHRCMGYLAPAIRRVYIPKPGIQEKRLLSAHNALTTLNEIAGGKMGWILEVELENFFGSLDHQWILHFVELPVLCA